MSIIHCCKWKGQATGGSGGSREVMENQWNHRNQPMSSIPQSNLTIRNTCPNFYNYREHFIINSLTSKVYMELGQTQGQFKERITSSITNLTWSSPLSFQPFWVPDVLFSSSYNRFPELHKITNTQIINWWGWWCWQDLDLLVGGGIINPVS